MDNYITDILEKLKAQYIKISGEKHFQNAAGVRSYYLCELDDNLYKSMDEKSFEEYGVRGGEIPSGKMNAVRSSAAMTYNLFWNRTAKIVNAKNIKSAVSDGEYEVEFEKKFHTLHPQISNTSANLDAFLYNPDTYEAIACEMKMMEWLCNQPGGLRVKYLEPANYYDGEAGEVFAAAAKKLIDYEKPRKLSMYPGRFIRYDAFQMFKHAAACYNACFFEEERKIKKLTLLNCVWNVPADVLGEKYYSRYVRHKQCELGEFNEFCDIMNPVKELFRDKGVDFNIEFCWLNDFIATLEKSQDELEYLKRYTFK